MHNHVAKGKAAKQRRQLSALARLEVQAKKLNNGGYMGLHTPWAASKLVDVIYRIKNLREKIGVL